MTAKQNTDMLKKKQQYLILGALALLGMVLLLIGNGNDTENAPSQQTPMAAITVSAEETAVTELEGKLEAVLAQVQGAGDVTVQISVKSMGRKEYAVDTQHSSRTSVEENGDTVQQSTETQEQRTVVQQNQNGVQNALLVEETMPEISGVLVVSSGAKDAVVAERLLNAVTTLLQISLHQIAVVPGEEAV